MDLEDLEAKEKKKLDRRIRAQAWNRFRDLVTRQTKKGRLDQVPHYSRGKKKGYKTRFVTCFLCFNFWNSLFLPDH